MLCAPNGTICRCLSLWRGNCLKLSRKQFNEGAIVVSKLDAAFNFQQAALSLRAQRQQIIAGNIANADTPNYKAQDIDFSAALENAVAGRSFGGSLPLAATSALHLQGSADSGPVRLLYRTPGQASADGNTVEMDAERANFSENAIRYEAGIAFITGRVRTLLSAIQGQ